MLYFLFVLGMGVGIGCSIAASDTKTVNGMTRTEYIRPVFGYNVGWRYDRMVNDYVFSLKLFKNDKPPGFFSNFMT